MCWETGSSNQIQPTPFCYYLSYKMSNTANFKVIGVDIGNKYLRIAYPDRIQREFLFSDADDSVIRELVFDPKADKNCYLGKNSDSPQVVVTGFRKFVMR